MIKLMAVLAKLLSFLYLDRGKSCLYTEQKYTNEDRERMIVT